VEVPGEAKVSWRAGEEEEDDEEVGEMDEEDE